MVPVKTKTYKILVVCFIVKIQIILNLLLFMFLSSNLREPDRDMRVNLQRLNKVQYTVMECNLW